MASPLEALAVELIEEVMAWLGLSDIAAVRLTSRSISAKASTGRFSSFFKTKTIDLTTKNLLRFVEVTKEGQPGCLLQHCIIRGIIRGDALASNDEDETQNQRLLSEAFQNLRQGSSGESLRSLNLQVAVLVKDSNGNLIVPKGHLYGREVWKIALHTFRVTMAALHDSQLPITQHLNIFGDIRGCSLGFDAFLAELAIPKATREFFGSLKKLTARLSAPPDLDEDPQTRGPPQARIGGKANDFLLEFLDVLPAFRHLESLDLHWYKLQGDSSAEPSVLSHKQRDTIPELPHLKDCHLRGVFTSETNLLHFLSAVQPAEVTLRFIRLTAGSYTSVFQYLTGQDRYVAKYHLDDLVEDKKLVYFNVPGSPKFNHDPSGPSLGPSTLSRAGAQSKEAIKYRFAGSRPLGSLERTQWIRFWAQEFGGTSSGRYDFIMLQNESEPGPLEYDTDDA